MTERPKAFITGITGFVGRHMQNELVNHGYDVKGTTRSENKQTDNIVMCDIRDAYTTEKLLRENSFDVVVFLAAQASVQKSFTSPEETKEINVGGTSVFLEALRKLGDKHPSKVIMVASSDIFGKPDRLPVSEASPLNPLNQYSESKVEEIHLIEYYRRKHGLDYIDILIPFNHTGPGQGPGFLPSDVASRLAEIQLKINPEPVLLTGNLSAKRDLSDVRDIVRAYRLLLEKKIRGGNYLLSSGVSVSMQWVVETLVNMCTVEVKRELDSRYMRPSDTPDIYGDISKLKRVINYSPSIPLEKTLVDLYNKTVADKKASIETVKIA